MRETLVEAFAHRGFRTTTAVDGQQTLEIVQREPIDIVLLDMYMPRLTGLDTMRRLSVLNHPPACVLMSSAMDEHLRRAAMDARDRRPGEALHLGLRHAHAVGRATELTQATPGVRCATPGCGVAPR